MAKDKDSGALPERFTRKFGETDDENDDDIGEFDEPVRPTPEQRDLAMLMDEIGASPKATVTIYRTTASKGKGAYIMQYPLSSKTLQEVMDYLRDVKKGGEFRFYIHDGSCMRGNQPVIVEPPTPEEMREYEAKVKSANPYPTQTAPAPNDQLTSLLVAMREDQQRRDDQAREEQKRRDEQAREERQRDEARRDRDLEREREDKKFMLQLLTSNKPEKSDLTEMITALASLQMLNGSGKKESDPLDMIDRVLGIQSKLLDNAPGAAKETSVAETAIKHMGAPLLTLLAQLNQQAPVMNPLPANTAPRTPERVITHETNPVAPGPAPQTPPVTQTEEEKLAMILAEIITAAQQNADPAPYAAKLIDGLGEDACAEVIDDDTAFEFLMTQLGQPAITHREWFDKLRAIMLDSLFEDDPNAANDEQDTDVSDQTGD